MCVFRVVVLYLMCVVGLKKISFKVCTCRPARLVLLSMGYFPCSPMSPTLAIDINVLQLVSQLFLCVGPNVTGWCQTLELTLSQRGYRLESEVCEVVAVGFSFEMCSFIPTGFASPEIWCRSLLVLCTCRPGRSCRA